MDPMVAASKRPIAPILSQEGYGFHDKRGIDKITVTIGLGLHYLHLICWTSPEGTIMPGL